MVSFLRKVDLGYKAIIDEEIRAVHALIHLCIIKCKTCRMKPDLYLFVCDTLGERNDNALRLLCQKIHYLIVSKARYQIVRTCHIGSVEAVDLTHEGEYECIVDKPELKEIVSYIGSHVTLLDNERHCTFRILIDNE